MKNISIKLQLVFFLSAILALLAFPERDTLFFIKSIIAVMVCVATELFFSFARARSFKITQNSLITGLIIGFVLSSYVEWWLFLLAGFLAIILKHLIRLDGKHIFNPAGLGIFLVAVIFNKATQWHGAYWWYIIVPFGLYFTWRIRKIPVVCAYFAMYILMAVTQWYWFKRPFWDQIYYANYFFIFVMLIEPKTSPFGFTGEVFFGIVVSVISFVLYWLKLPFDADLPALLVGNLIFRLYAHKWRTNGN